MTRDRSTTLIDNAEGPFTWSGYDKFGTNTSNYTTTPHHVKTKRVIDTVTPNFFTAMKQGAFLPINPVRMETVETQYISGNAGSMQVKDDTAYGPGSATLYSGNASDIVISYDALPEHEPGYAEISNVVIKAIASAKSPAWDALTFLGEFHKTVELLRTGWGKLDTFIQRAAAMAHKREYKRAIRELRKYTPQKALDDFNDIWLELRYGYRPILYDMQNVMSALRHKSQSMVQRKSATHSYDIDESNGGSMDYGSVRYDTTFTRTGSCKLRAVVFYMGDMSAIGANPVVTSWELTTLSFVLDWFTNVGSWLQAVTPRKGYWELGVSVSAVLDYTDEVRQTASEGSSHTWNVNLTDLVKQSHYNIYRRWQWEDIFPIPSVQINLSPAKFIDLAALALSSLDRVKRKLRL